MFFLSTYYNNNNKDAINNMNKMYLISQFMSRFKLNQKSRFYTTSDRLHFTITNG